jgi:predicted aspartyl protease
MIVRNPIAPEQFAEADAIVDTGASCIVIGKRLAQELSLTRTGQTRLLAVGAEHTATEYAATVCVPELDFERFLPVYAPQGVVSAPTILLGRSFLEFFALHYDGQNGMFSFDRPERFLTLQESVDE